MNVQAELANAIKARHKKVYGVESPSSQLLSKKDQVEKPPRQPAASNVRQSSKDSTHKAAAAVLAAKMGKPTQSYPVKTRKQSLNASFPKGASAASTLLLSENDETIATRYRKMLKTGLPVGAVLHKMAMDSIEQHIQDSVMKGGGTPGNEMAATAVSNTTTPSGSIVVSLLSKEDEIIATRYRKMIKTGLPIGAVLHKMAMDKIEKHVQDSVINGGGTPGNEMAAIAVSNTTTTSGVVVVSSLSKEDEIIATRYRKMLKTGLPMGAVLHKMAMDRIEKHVQDSVINGGGTPANEMAATAAAVSDTTTSGSAVVSSLSKDDEAIATRYRKMLKTGLPMGAVIHKMVMDNIEKHVQDSVIKAEIPVSNVSSVKVSDEPTINSIAAAITSSGGIGTLKKVTPVETNPQYNQSSNPLAAAIADSGGIGALKKTSVQKKEIKSGKCSNPLAAAIAASGGRIGLKKVSVNSNKEQPSKPQSSNTLVDKPAEKGFCHNLKKNPQRVSQQPRAKNGHVNLSDEISSKAVPSSLRKAPSKKSYRSIGESSPTDNERLKSTRTDRSNKISGTSTQYVAPKPSQKQTSSRKQVPVPKQKSKAFVPQKQARKNVQTTPTNTNNNEVQETIGLTVSRKQPSTEKCIPSKSKSIPKQKSKAFVRQKKTSKNPQPSPIVVNEKQKAEVYMPSFAVQKPKVYVPPKSKYAPPEPVSTSAARATQQTPITEKQPTVVLDDRDHDRTQTKQTKKKVKNSNKNKNKKTNVRDDGAEQHCQCVVM